MVFARALVAMMLLARIARADLMPRVPMALLDAPASFEDDRFVTALGTYVTNARVDILRLTQSSDEACRSLVKMAGVFKTPVVLWARWIDGTMTISLVFVDKGCAEPESSTVDVPREQPAFIYRVAALKIASLLRTLPGPTELVTDRPMPVAAPKVTQRVVIEGQAPADRAIEVGATGVASTESAARTYAVVASGWFGTRFSVGATLLASLAHDETTAGGTGRARLFGALVGGRIVFVESGRIAVVGELAVGVASVWSSADRSNGVEAMSERVWTPLASLAPHVQIAIAGPVYVSAGPTLDVSRSIDLSLGETALYQASPVRFRWDIRARVSF